MIGGALNLKAIRTHWNEIVRLATSIKQGTVTASLMLRKLGSYPRQNGLAVALRELGRIERTLFISPGFRASSCAAVSMRDSTKGGTQQGGKLEYGAASVAKVEHDAGELFPRIGSL
jgi:hypothetical protein